MVVLANISTVSVIDGDDLADAVDDPKVADLIARSVAYGARLRAAGRDHSIDFDD
ncbi:MAG TPA: hypothetical protein VN238_21945 [Solirubrobacteraceae bacterium]|nr:hypothetical protein [Solirubrobacteraceae bacterium]